MNFLNDILRSIKEAYQARNEPEGARFFANIYWRSLLFVVIVVVITTIFFAGQLLLRILHGIGTPPSGGLPATAFERADLQKAIDDFAARQDTYDSLRKGGSGSIADPSR